MKDVPKYITSIRIQPEDAKNINISIGFEKNGVMMVSFQDTAALEQDSTYINDNAYPNSAIIAHGKYEMWVSMFTRHVTPSIDDQMD